MSSCVCPFNVLNSFPVFVSHIIIVLSQEPLVKYPFGKTAKHQTSDVCPFNVFILIPVFVSQIIIVLSSEQLANNAFGKTTKQLT